MTDREVMQQALKALESGLAFSTHSPVLQNLRAALEQPENEPLTHDQRCLIIASAIHGHVSTRGAIDWAIKNVERHHGIKGNT